MNAWGLGLVWVYAAAAIVCSRWPFLVPGVLALALFVANMMGVLEGQERSRTATSSTSAERDEG